MDAKSFADLITYSRGFLAFLLVWLGIAWGKLGLNLAICVMFLDWIGDFFDGKLARKNQHQRKSWIGDHDIHVDVFVSLGLVIFLMEAQYIYGWVVLFYLSFWIFFYLKFGLNKQLLMLFQTPIYGYFIWISILDAPTLGRWLIGLILVLSILNFRRFTREIVPSFIYGILDFWKRRSSP